LGLRGRVRSMRHFRDYSELPDHALPQNAVQARPDDCLRLQAKIGSGVPIFYPRLFQTARGQ
jgi:hypothetical protein